MKLTGSIFKHPMEFNQVMISGDVIQIHNTDNTGYGFMQQYRSPETEKGEISFVLNKKNYSLLGNLQEFDLKIQGDVISVEAKGFKAKFSDMKDVALNQPDTTDMQSLSVDYKDIYTGRGFAGAPDNARMNLDGATIRKEGIIMMDSKRMYFKSIPDKNRPEINIPIDAFKRLGNENYVIKTNGRSAVFINGGHAYYTPLINSLVPMVNPPKADVIFEVEKGEVLKCLKMLKSYTDTVLIEVENGVMTLSATVEANEVKLNVPIKAVNLKKILVSCSIDNLSALLNITEKEAVRVNAMSKALFVQNESVTALAMLMTCKGMEVTGNE